MLKNILNLSGAQQLSRNEQKSINGGICESQYCAPGYTRQACIQAGGAYAGCGCVFGSCNSGGKDFCTVNPELC